MKQKTHSGTKKRTKITGSGKLRHGPSCKNHLLSSKSRHRKNMNPQGVASPKGHKKKLKRLLNIT